jgi:hypothetical protein
MTTPTPDIVQRLREPSDRSLAGQKLPDGSFNMGCQCGWGPGRPCSECILREDPMRREAATTIETLREAVRVLGEEKKNSRRIIDEVTGLDKPAVRIYPGTDYLDARAAVDANPSARDACEAAKGTD